ncbi:MAG: phosphoribosylaminoimidazolesuccinocarboxamide synthase [Nitrososphaerales archaeon]
MRHMFTREGSAKKIVIEKLPRENEMGIGYFIPKDSFSIFDYKVKGKWPFDIKNKGLAMRYIINKSFEIAKSHDIRTCFIESTEDGCKIYVVRVPGENGFPREPDEIEVGARNRVVDLEVVFNYYLHPRSSLLRDFKARKKNFNDYGFTEMPQGGEIIPSADHGNFKLAYTTKYDKSGDIPLTEEQAKKRSRLTDEQWDQGQEMIKKCIPLISKYAEQKELLRADGKYELFVDSDGNVGLADTFGNPEEDRYLLQIKDFSVIERFVDFYQSRWSLDPAKVSAVIDEVKKEPKHFQDFSKQFLRNWYIDNGWKKLYSEGKAREPPMMPMVTLNAYSDCLLSFASIWSGKVGDIVNSVGDITRPIVEVASELLVLEYFNKKGLVPS